MDTYDKLARDYHEDKNCFKVVPKFKVGDWIVSNYNNVTYIESISDTKYNLQCKDGFHEKMSIEYIDRNWHIWTIQDAKDGDVLAVDSMPFIYNGNKNEVTVGAYCGFNAKHLFSFAYNYVINQNITPATKEQQELLFVKIKEEGYIWDEAIKKLTKKIGDVKKIRYDSLNCQKNVCLNWSKDDDKILDKIVSSLMRAGNVDGSNFNIMYNWLKSIKERLA